MSHQKSENMKKNKRALVAVIIIAALVIALAIVLVVALVIGARMLSGHELDTGRAVNCGDGSYAIVRDDGQILKMNSSADRLLFESLGTGDRILILRSSAIALSYPGQCYVKLCVTLSRGTEDNIPDSALEELRRIGWID